MMMRTFLTTSVLLITCLAMSQGFTIPVGGGGLTKPATAMMTAASSPMNGYYASSSLCMASSSPNDDDNQEPKKLMQFGQDRGNILQLIALSICVWLFSIPTEFRRAHFCGTPSCALAENRAKCYDCITMDEWTAGVADYYKNGGSVHFDFSIDPKTQTLWSN